MYSLILLRTELLLLTAGGDSAYSFSSLCNEGFDQINQQSLSHTKF